jgi:hypothetical protein
MNDPDQFLVYHAESEAFRDESILFEWLPHDRLLELTKEITSGMWWKMKGDVQVTVRQTVWGTSGEGIAFHGIDEIAYADGAHMYVVTHELAHILNGGGKESHGKSFRGWHIDIVEAYFGIHNAVLLSDSYTSQGLDSTFAVTQPVKEGWRSW